jgi:predicted porin
MKTITAALMASASLLALAAGPARADDYTDLLDILHARGSLSQGEYSSLLAKHLHGKGPAARHRRGAASVAPVEPGGAEAMSESRRDALAAASAAAAAQASEHKMEVMAQDMETSPDIVHVQPYKPGAGVTMRVGAVDLNFSGIVNGFYTYSSADSAGHTPAGGLADGSGFDSSAIRNGLLPGAFIFTASTTQAGIDVSATFGVYPGINTSDAGVLGANTGGNATALGTAGGDFRKTFMTFGTKELGTIKIGRDIAIFGSDAILNDATLLSVGATGGNADPANTSLGRIGLGYIYTDFLPQITYISPTFAGFQATIGAIQPMNEFDFSGLSGTAAVHSTPEFEGKVTWDYKGAALTAHAWAGFMTQSQQQITALDEGVPTNNKVAGAGEGGATVTFGPASVTGYYYKGKGVGTTAKFFDGISAGGELRASEGGYLQGTYKILPKLKLAGSYGESSLYRAAGDVDPNLVRRNEAYIGAAYYSLTDWVTLVGEYAHEESKSHGPLSVTSNAVTAGAILFY